jgi:hypothetical protein
VTTKPRRTEVHQFSKPTKNRFVWFCCCYNREHVEYLTAYVL